LSSRRWQNNRRRRKKFGGKAAAIWQRVEDNTFHPGYPPYVIILIPQSREENLWSFDSGER
jgi:hypothetical protein